jgi:hypothetical protein
MNAIWSSMLKLVDKLHNELPAATEMSSQVVRSRMISARGPHSRSTGRRLVMLEYQFPNISDGKLRTTGESLCQVLRTNYITDAVSDQSLYAIPINLAIFGAMPYSNFLNIGRSKQC